jgi:chemotaxis signal transduction protein
VSGGSTERLLTFEVGNAAFALPILDVHEVSEPGPVGPVPSLPRSVGGVMHYHGDALPVVSAAKLLGVVAEESVSPDHVVVVADRSGGTPRLGVPVDRVLGLADIEPAPVRGAGVVVSRIPIEGRVTSVLDAEMLCNRAADLIGGAGAFDSNDSEHGGET